MLNSVAGPHPVAAREGARLWGAAAALREEIGAPLPAHERRHYEEAQASARGRLDEAMWAAAWAEGRAMPLEQAVAYALEETVTFP